MIALRIHDEFRMVGIAAPAYLDRHPTPMVPQDLRAHDCIRQRMAWDGAIRPWEFERAGERPEAAVDGSLIVNDTHVVRSAALDGGGIADLAEGGMAPRLEAGPLAPSPWDVQARRPGLV